MTTAPTASNRPVAAPPERTLRPRTAALLGTLLAALLAGCASPGPERSAPPMTTAQQLGLAANPLRTAVPWPDLGDPALDALLRQALADQPNLAAARERVERARALADATRAANGAQAALSADLTRQRYSENGLVPPPIAGATWSSGDLNAGLSWSPDFFGLHRAELAAALGQARAAEADAAAAAVSLSAQISRGWVQLARLFAQRELAERSIAQREAMLALVRERRAAGLDTGIDLAQAQGSLPELRAQREALDEQIALLRHQLATLAGQPVQSLDHAQPRLDTLHLPTLPGTLGADLLGRRPDVLAARERAEAATQGVQAARAGFYPDIRLSAFVGLSAIGISRLFEAGSAQLGLTPALRLPLFDGGALRAQLGAREAERNAAIAQYNATMLEAVRQARDALVSIDSVDRQRAEQAQALERAEAAYALVQQRERAGLSNRLQLLAAETAVLAQRRTSADLQARAFDTRVALIQALGGGWPDEATPQLAAHRP